MPLFEEREFMAQDDLETLVRAKKIEQDKGRVAAAKSFAERRAEELRTMADQLPGRPPRQFNGAVKSSRMESRDGKRTKA